MQLGWEQGRKRMADTNQIIGEVSEMVVKKARVSKNDDAKSE